MGMMTQYYIDEAKKLEEARAEMEKKNHEHMERLAKCKSTPTVAEIQRAASGEHVHEHEYDGSPIQHVHPVPVEEKVVEHKVEKVIEPKPAHEKGAYVTRASNAKKE